MSEPEPRDYVLNIFREEWTSLTRMNGGDGRVETTAEFALAMINEIIRLRTLVREKGLEAAEEGPQELNEWERRLVGMDLDA